MLVNAIHALDDDLVFVGIDAQDAAALALVLAGQDFDNVVFLEVHRKLSRSQQQGADAPLADQTTSAARLTIFKKPRSRSSRATAPKIRVPRGFSSSLFKRTIALRSKRT